MPTPTISRFEPVQFEPHEREVHRLLGLMGGAPADQYADAIRILRGTPPLQTRSHLLAHMAREIESALRELLWSLVPADVRRKLEAEKPKGQRDPDRKSVINAICSALGFDDNDPIRTLWIESGAWHGAAHRAALLAPRPMDAELIGRWEQLGAVLRVILRAYEGSFIRALPMIDELAAADPVTKDDVSRLMSQVPNSVPALDRFFEQATSAWFPKLLDKGYFRSPAALQSTEDGLVTYVPWPPGRYLVRMVQKPDLMQNVVEVVRRLDTDNPGAVETVADVALAAPVALVRPLAGMIAQLLRSPAQWALPSKAIELLPKLTADGQLDEAAAILAEMLPGQTRSYAGGGYLPPDHVSQLFPRMGVPGVAVIATRLAQLTDNSSFERSHSRFWWPDITSRRSFRARDILVTMLRDAATSVAADAGPAEIVRVLETHPGGIFRRLALYVLLLSPEPDPVRQRLTDPALFHDPDCFVEYGQLLRAHFADLRTEDRARITALIDEGPLQTDDADAIQRWRARYLVRFGDALPDAYVAERDTLVRELGRPDIVNHVIEFTSHDSADVARGPLPALDDMTDDEIISFLTSWTPTGRLADPDPDDLREGIEAAAARNPRRFAALSPRFTNLDPTYALGLLAGLRQAISLAPEPQESAEPVAEWDRILAFGAAILTQPGWSRTREELAELIAAGLRSDIPTELLEQTFALIKQLLDDPDPGGTDGQSFTNAALETAVNSVRGNAWLALLQYAIRKHDPAAPTFELALSQLLELHLDPAVETSPAIHSLYGYKINLLRELDPSWIRERICQIFPDITAPGFASVAWSTYLQYGRISPQTVALLLPLYEQHATALAESSEATSSADSPQEDQPEDNLLQHLALLYRDGAIPSGADWFDQFLEHAPLRLRTRLIELIGLQLHESDPVGPEQSERLKSLWEKRLNAATQPSGDTVELTGFGYWFTSGKLPEDWLLTQLNSALAAGATLSPSNGIAERLATYGFDSIEDTVTAIAGMIDTADRPWFITGAREAIITVLHNGLRSADPETQRLAQQTVSRLIARGHTTFVDLA